MWSLYQKENKLEPLVFSNGKTQADIVAETLQAVNEGYKIIFIKGMCGTGKSAIALNIARQLGKTAIVVPIKSLQEQYLNDYTQKLHILNKEENNKLKISVILGRNNFKCRFIEEEAILESSYHEKNARLSDIFQKQKETDNSCDNQLLPCKIEIKEKNITQIKNYLNKNPLVKIRDFNSLHNVKRMAIAPVCEYYSPILPQEMGIHFKNATEIPYQGLDNQRFIIHQRKKGCPFYDQYLSYTQADVLIFNSLKYKLETIMNRKPQTEVEIIDECDEFLDSFANIEKISLNKLAYSLNLVFAKDKDTENIIKSLLSIIESIKELSSQKNAEEITRVSDTPVEELIITTIAHIDFLNDIETEESNYLFHLTQVAKMFYELKDETFFTIEKKDNDFTLNLVTVNLKKRFQELLDKNKIIILMSGTIHTPSVLKNLYGLQNFKIIEAETNAQGALIKCRHGYEIDCKYTNFASAKISRETYLKAFQKTVEAAKRPTLVHITSFSDLPTDFEKDSYGLTLPSQTQLHEEQKNEETKKRIADFKNKKTLVLFTTKCNRGVDFPGDMCNSIIISRFPYPNISSIFWKILKKTNPQEFMNFYMDKAKREILQRVYRGLRSKSDKVYLLSPDKRVLDFDFT